MLSLSRRFLASLPADKKGIRAKLWDIGHNAETNMTIIGLRALSVLARHGVTGAVCATRLGYAISATTPMSMAGRFPALSVLMAAFSAMSNGHTGCRVTIQASRRIGRGPHWSAKRDR